MKTNAHFTRFGLAVVLTVTVSFATGCKSGGSKWAWWNPMSRSAADTSLIARTAPALPSDAATPLIEGVTPPAVTAIASTTAPSTTAAAPGFTPPSLPKATIPPAGSIASSTPAQEAAKLASTPEISTPAAQPYMAAAKNALAQAMTPADAYAAAGPYNPNAYQPSTPAQAKSSTPASSGRYGSTGDRYASVASNAVNTVTEAVPDFSNPAAPTAQATPDRYGRGGRYAAAAVTPAPTTPSQVAPAATLAAATPPPVTPIASESQSPAALATPPTASVYSTASAVPTTVPNVEPRSEIRLTSLPGEYRPGGTGTFQAGVNVATRPGTTAPATTQPATTPRYR